jgi:23S rRNA pseudouridine2605 synthase
VGKSFVVIRGRMRLPPRHVTLERALSKLGLASRAEARGLIAAGRVEVDGRRVTNPRTAVVPERTRITVDGTRAAAEPWRLVLFHKPRGIVTTRRDPEGRPTVYTVLQAGGSESWIDRLVPVGRLDLASTGLLLLTSDTRLADWLTDPKNRIARKYVVTVRGELTDETLTRLKPRSTGTVTLIKRSKRETHVFVELTEGKNREIRRMFDAVGHEVTRLKRIAFGGLELGSLQSGRWRDVTRAELQAAFPAALRTRDPGLGTRGQGPGALGIPSRRGKD